MKGVNKLNEAKALVHDLKSEAAVKSEVLAEKQKEADAALNEITTRIQEASEKKQEMEVLKTNLGEETVKLEQRKKAIDIELADIQPLVDEAKKAVGAFIHCFLSFYFDTIGVFLLIVGAFLH